MRYLLIGGPNDGERHAIPEGLGIYRVVDTSRASIAEPLHASLTYTVALYRPFQLAARDKQFTVYAHESITPEEVMERLIEGYHGYAYMTATVAAGG